MTRKKPVGVFVLGILHLIFGGLTLASNCCGSIAMIGLYFLFQGLYQQVPENERGELDELGKAFLDSVPYVREFFVASLVVSLCLSLLQFLSGISLVRVRNGGRIGSVVWAVFYTVVLIGSLTYQMAIMTPGMEKGLGQFETWLQKQEKKQRDRGQPVQPRQPLNKMGTGNPVLDNALTIAFSLFGFGYAMFTLVYCLLPSTARKIADYNAPEDSSGSSSGGRDFYDDDYRDPGTRPPGGSPPNLNPPEDF